MATATHPGAQTERRGMAWAGEELASRQNLTGLDHIVHPSLRARRPDH